MMNINNQTGKRGVIDLPRSECAGQEHRSPRIRRRSTDGPAFRRVGIFAHWAPN